jgi:hypothetical protein
MADWVKMVALYFILEILFGAEIVAKSNRKTYFLVKKLCIPVHICKVERFKQIK